MLEVQERDTAAEYLSGLMDLVVRASPGPFRLTPASRGQWRIVGGRADAVIAIVTRRVDAELLAAALPAIRALASATAAVLGQHRPGAEGGCVSCGQPAPCSTRLTIEHELSARPGRLA